MKLQQALLTRGYFPKELPPAFTTLDFGTHSSAIMADWRVSKLFSEQKIKKKSGNYTYSLWETESEVLSTPKKGYERRPTHVTHPLPQCLLAYEMSSNWAKVATWIDRQTFTLDKIRVSDSFPRSLKGIDFRLHETKKDFIESTSDWLIRTDISRFYPSIYTHSIPWAAYGKAKVKASLKTYVGSLADRLDQLVRLCNRNQTVGIPIGPETSRILAEIISSRIDSEIALSVNAPAIDQTDRLQDDWFIGATTLEESERLLSLLIKTYRGFGLDINGSKTSVQHILARSKPTWRAQILSVVHSHMRLEGSRLKDLLQMALRLQAEFPTERIISYTISIVEGLSIRDVDVQLVESFLLESLAIAPISTDRICQVFIDLNHNTNLISKRRVVGRCKDLCERSFENSNTFETLWLLYTMRGLGFPFVSRKIAEVSGHHDGSCIPIVLLDMRARGTFRSSLPISKWEGNISAERIRRDWIWLLAYEGIRNGWINDKKNVMSGAFFSPMHARKVQFYDPKKNIASVRSARKKRMAGIIASVRSSRSLIAALRATRAIRFRQLLSRCSSAVQAHYLNQCHGLTPS